MKSVPVTGMGWIPLIAATAGLLAGGAGPAWSQQQCPASAAACQFDVSADYFALLGRTPDWGGWTFWYYQIYTAGLPRDTMTSDLLASQEYYNSCGTKLDNKTYYTIGLDTTKNPAVPGGLAAGTYGQQGGPPSWCGNQTYSAQWAPSNSDFLTLFYWDAVNRAPDEDGWGFWYCGLVPSATPCNSSNQPITQAQTVDNFLTSTEFANDWGVSNVVTPGPATVNPTSLSNGGWQTVTVAYTSCLGQTCGVSGVGSGTVFVGTGNPTVYGSTLTGCEIEWTAGQSVALYELYNGTSTESSGTMPGSGVLGGAAVCALDTAHSSYNPNTGTLSLSLSYLSTMSGQQTVYSYGADAQGWPTLPGISLATFTIGSAPTITSVSSLSTAVGGQITIYGTNFVAEPTVYFGNVQASVVSWTSGASGSVTAGVPCTLAPGSPYPISITVAGLSSGPYSQSFTPPVAIVSTPSPAPLGSAVTISGSNFGACGGSVTFGGAPATVTSWGGSQIVADVPTTLTVGAGYLVYVIVNGVQGASPGYFYPQAPQQAPSITSLSLTSGPVQMGVVITGQNFGAAGTVALGGANMPVVAWRPTQITVGVPAGTQSNTPLSVTVTANGLPSQNNPTFTVVAPFGCQ